MYNFGFFLDSKVTIAIQLLSYMISPKQRIKQYNCGKSKHSKSSIVSSRDSMIKCVTVSTLIRIVFIHIFIYMYIEY